MKITVRSLFPLLTTDMTLSLTYALSGTKALTPAGAVSLHILILKRLSAFMMKVYRRLLTGKSSLWLKTALTFSICAGTVRPGT